MNLALLIFWSVMLGGDLAFAAAGKPNSHYAFWLAVEVLFIAIYAIDVSRYRRA